MTRAFSFHLRDKLDDGHFGVVTGARANTNDSGIATWSRLISLCKLTKKLLQNAPVTNRLASLPNACDTSRSGLLTIPFA